MHSTKPALAFLIYIQPPFGLLLLEKKKKGMSKERVLFKVLL